MNKDKLVQSISRILYEFECIETEVKMAQVLMKSIRYEQFSNKCMDLIIASLTSRICRLLDNEQKSTSNLRKICKEINCNADPSAITSLLTILDQLYSYLKPYRDKALSHLDHEILLDNQINPMPEIPVVWFSLLNQLKDEFKKYARDEMQIGFSPIIYDDRIINEMNEIFLNLTTAST